MENSMKKILGILGGMGPAATADLYGKIVALTEALSDGEHIRTIIDSNVNIPDRTAAILSGGESPLEEMEAALDNLVCCGAEVIIIPCNTAHYFLPALKDYAADNYDVECCASDDTECCAADTECCGLQPGNPDNHKCYPYSLSDPPQDQVSFTALGS